MQRTMRPTLAVCAMAVVGSWELFGVVGAEPVAGDAAAPQKQSADEKAIRQSAAAFVKAFNAGDAQAIAALWTTDGEYVDPWGQRSEGREAIGKQYAEFFGARPDTKMKINVEAVRLLSDGAAIEEGTATLTTGQEATPSRAHYVAIHVKNEDGWRMASVRDVAMPPAASDGLRSLEWLVGRWSAEHAGARVTLVSQWIAERQYLQRRFKTTRGDEVLATSTEIVGWCPIRGQVVSWTFASDGGRAHGLWVPIDKRWVVEAAGVTVDGSPTMAVNVWNPLEGGAIGWRSTGRMFGNVAQRDARDVVFEPQSPVHETEKREK